MPGLAAAAGRSGECLAMTIGAGDAAEVGAFAEADAGDEERHRLRRLLRCRLLRDGDERAANQRDRERGHDGTDGTHETSSCVGRILHLAPC